MGIHFVCLLRIFVNINSIIYMKTHAALYLAIFTFLSLQSCGVMPLSADQGQRVQTKFFGANFGDKGEYAVKDKMVHNGIGYRWSFVEKGTWGMQNVSFAGNDWETALVRFTEQNFSSISFADSFSSEEEALEKLDELRELLGKKYNLQRKTDSDRGRHVYYFRDSIGNLVFVAVAKLKLSNSDRWSCGITYSWYKASQIAEEKALNDI